MNTMLGIGKFMAGVAVPSVLVTFGYLSHFQTVTFRDVSMEPTIADGEIGICRKVSSLPKEQKSLKKGDVVVLISPDDPYKLLCKRIAGVEGDEIPLGTYAGLLSSLGIGSLYKEVVPTGHVWLEGDNPSHSHDSRSYGSVPMGLVTSVVRLKINYKDRSIKMVEGLNTSDDSDIDVDMATDANTNKSST